MKSNHKNCSNLIGMRFGRLVVVERGEDKIDAKSGKHKTTWICNCDCGTTGKTILGTALTTGATQSCGCLHKEVARETAKHKISHGKKYNTYDISGEFGIGYTTKNEEFYFDLEDYELIKDVCWYKNPKGYLIGNYMGKTVKMSRLIMNVLDDSSVIVDHINSDNKFDNRKSNLRVTTQQKNTLNRKRSSNNTSGRTGVSWNKGKNKWSAYIKYEGKTIFLGDYSDKEDAIHAREEAEQHYFKEYKYIGETP